MTAVPDITLWLAGRLLGGGASLGTPLLGCRTSLGSGLLGGSGSLRLLRWNGAAL